MLQKKKQARLPIRLRIYILLIAFICIHFHTYIYWLKKYFRVVSTGVHLVLYQQPDLNLSTSWTVLPSSGQRLLSRDTSTLLKRMNAKTPRRTTGLFKCYYKRVVDCLLIFYFYLKITLSVTLECTKKYATVFTVIFISFYQ